MQNVSNTRLALMLLRIDGVGRVAANRLTRAAGDLDALRRYPTEQLVHRLAGLPNGALTAKRLNDDEYLMPLLASVDEEVAVAQRHRVDITSVLGDDYPRGLFSLDDRDRPVVMYRYGKSPLTASPSVAFLGSSPIDSGSFERSQEIVTRIAGDGMTILLSAESGFDVALAKRAAAAGSSVVLVLHAGLDHMPRELRSTAAQVVKSGGSVLTSFPLGHGPFPHDVYERSLVLAGLANAVVISNADPTSDRVAAAKWAIAS